MNCPSDDFDGPRTFAAYRLEFSSTAASASSSVVLISTQLAEKRLVVLLDSLLVFLLEHPKPNPKGRAAHSLSLLFQLNMQFTFFNIYKFNTRSKGIPKPAIITKFRYQIDIF